MAQPIVFCASACSRFRSQPPQRSNTTMSRAGSSFSIKAAIPAASLLYRCTLPASSHATSSHDLPISTPITRLSSMLTSLILGKGPERALDCIRANSPLYRSCPDPETPAGPQICTIVKIYRDREVPPASHLPSGRRQQHASRDRTKHPPSWPALTLRYAHISDVIAGLDPAIHLLRRIVAKRDGCAGQARA